MRSPIILVCQFYCNQIVLKNMIPCRASRMPLFSSTANLRLSIVAKKLNDKKKEISYCTPFGTRIIKGHHPYENYILHYCLPRMHSMHKLAILLQNMDPTFYMLATSTIKCSLKERYPAVQTTGKHLIHCNCSSKGNVL